LTGPRNAGKPSGSGERAASGLLTLFLSAGLHGTEHGPRLWSGEAKAAAGVGFRERRSRRRRSWRDSPGMACKTSKLTDSQPGSDMQSRQQEQIAAVGGCHSCPIWQAVESRGKPGRG